MKEQSHPMTEEELQQETLPAQPEPSAAPETEPQAAADSAAAAPEDPADEIAAAVRQQRELQQNREARRAAMRKRKIQRRRLAALAAVGVVLLVILGVALGSLIRRWTRPQTQNLGPLPTETVVVTRLPKYYDYAQPVPQSTAVTDSWFSDALLVGDTRVQCLDLYGQNPFGTLLYGSAIDVGKALEYSCREAGTEASISLYDKLTLQPYRKIYLSLGLNELGWNNTGTFVDEYRKLVLSVRNLQPDAEIYLVGIFPVTASQDGRVSYITNERIKTYNGLISQLALELEIYYLDSYTAMSDAAGALPANYASGGVNLVKEGCAAWMTFFKNHTVNPEEYIN